MATKPPIPPRATLPNLALHADTKREAINAAVVVDGWLTALQQRFESRDFADLSPLFVADSWWRDVASLTFDIRALSGPSKIASYLAGSEAEPTKLEAARPPSLIAPTVVDMAGSCFIQSGFSFETRFGTSRGIVRLANVSPTEWKAWTVSSALDSVKPPQEQLGSGQGLNNHPQVLLIGAGQSSLSVAAHLKQLGISFKIIERASGPGGGWRARYQTIASHTPRWSDHLPFLPFPDDMPLWLKRDDLTNWLEHYTKTLGLDVEYDTALEKLDYDAASHTWTAQVSGKEEPIRAHHVYYPGGLDAIPNAPVIAGQELFKGQIYHTSAHRSAGDIADLANKRVVVVGAASSGHDVAQDFVAHGAKAVHLVQRSPIWSVSTKAMSTVMLSNWAIPGMTVEEADLLSMSMPTALMRALDRIVMSPAIEAMDKDLVDALEKAGVAVCRSDGETTLLDHHLIYGGRFYADQGASGMIIDGRIKVHYCPTSVKELKAGGVVLGDSTEIDADIVVLATGFKRFNTIFESVLSPEMYARLKACEADEEQERGNLHRPSGVPGLWTGGGGFTVIRAYTKRLALQIAAIENGYNDGYWNA